MIRMKDHKQQIKKLAWDFAQSTLLEYDEALSIANESAIIASRTFDEEKCTKFNSHLVNTIKWRFYNEIRKRTGQITMRIDECKLPYGERRTEFIHEIYNVSGLNEVNFMMYGEIPDTDADLLFKDTLEHLSDDAKQVAYFVLNEDFMDVIGLGPEAPPKYIRTLLRNYFYNDGWSRKRVSQTFKELREAFPLTV